MIDPPAAGPGRPAPAWWSPWTATGATLSYTALAIVFTWPLATRLTRSIPWDMGDPVLNSWILAWSADHLWRLLTGHFDAFSGYWNANIFHPEPLALAYSEHLFGQALLVLPVWAATGNAVLCYNLVLLGTFVLSGLGAFLLARDLTGDPRAAFVAGVIFGFAPYRIGQLSHVQVLSAQWMPFALFALRRHLATDRLAPLAGFTAAMVLQHLSCGYYLVYFTPLAAAFAACEIGVRRRWRDGRLLTRLSLSAGVIAAATWPFLAPYLALRRLGFPPRPLAEVMEFSGNTWGYLTAHPAQWLWGPILAAWRQPEGELFPGAIALLLAIAGTSSVARAAWAGSAGAGRATGWRRPTAVVAAIVLAAATVTGLVLLAVGGVSVRVNGQLIRASGVDDAFARAVLGAAVLLFVSRRARAAARTVATSPACWFLLLVVVAVTLSFGPAVRSGPALVVRDAPYGWLYQHVPGYDGLRVPARYAMIVSLGLAMLAAYGARAAAGRVGRPAAVAATLALLVAVEGGAAPLPLDRNEPVAHGSVPLPVLPSTSDPPALYRFVQTLRADAVLAEFPFGTEAFDVRYMFASTLHWRRLVNGYSGGVPQSYSANAGALRDVFRDPETAWARLRAAGTTHVIVHQAAFPGRAGTDVTAWLRRNGAAPLREFGDDVVLRMP